MYTMNNILEFSKYTGNGIKVAVIDTRVDFSHPDFEKCKTTYIKTRNKEINKEDLFGHGTACAWIIHRKATDAQIISLDAMNNIGEATPVKILESLEWAVANKIDIINLSVGSLNDKYIKSFIELAEKANKENITIVAANHDSGLHSIPARLENYIGVSGKSVIGKYAYYYIDGDINIVANGGRQRVGWTNPRYVFLHGSSFAAAHMSGIIALIKEAKPNINNNELLNVLKENAKPNDGIYNNIKMIDNTTKHKSCNSEFFKIKNAVVYNFNKEMHHMIRFNDLLSFNISAIVDIPQKGNIGKDPNRIIGLNPSKYRITKDLNEALQNADTLIISKTEMLDGILQKNILKDVLENAVKNNVNIYSLEYLDEIMYPQIFEKAKTNKIKIRHPMIYEHNLFQSEMYREFYGHIGNTTPILGIFGTGTSQGKFTLQLMIRKLLKREGYNIFNLGTEIHSELFGFESFYPMENEQSIKFDKWNMIPYLQGEMRKLEMRKPDIIVAGSQSGTIPQNFALPSRNYTLPSLAFLMGVLPHFYILVVNPDDEISYIKNTINVLEAIGKGKVILLVFSDTPRVAVNNSSVVIRKKMTLKDIEDTKKWLETAVRIKATEVISESGQELLLSKIYSSFS